jgi:phage shock protein C
MTRLTLNRANKKILGVCSGLADWSNIDVTLLRIVFVAATLIGIGSPIILYILMAMILD